MVELIKLEKEELQEYAEIAIEAFESDKNTYGQYPPLIDIEHRTVGFIDDGNTFKIVKDSKMVGGIAVFNHNNGVYTLGSIFIKPAFQKQGIGQKVITLIEDKYSDTKKWVLDTPYRNFGNHYFYEKMGYVKTGEFSPDENSDFKLFSYEKLM